ncbi:MAG TPA: hypothetical protein VJ793_21890 [Anaerolineae bacterium]|nr:hypothetical protein [Anaerolineae bacterium]
MEVLTGRLDHAAIAAAGEANRNTVQPPLSRLLDACVRYAAVASVCLQRGQIWSAVEVLHRMRGILMELFARAHGGSAPSKPLRLKRMRYCGLGWVRRCRRMI